MEIRPALQHYLDLCHQPTVPPVPSEEAIVVSAATKRIASAYERFRNILEPEEEDILRRNAIWRILLRRVPEDSPTAIITTPQATAVALLQELIRANYIKAASQTTAIRIGHKVANLRALEQRLERSLFEWLLEIATIDIDREFIPRANDEALVHLMYHDTYNRTVWTDGIVEEADRPAQLFIACHRALITADEREIIYHYFRHHFPVWQKDATLTEAELDEVADELPSFYQTMMKIVYHPAHQRLVTLLKSSAVPYRILRDMCPQTDQATLMSPEKLASTVQQTVQSRGTNILQRINARARHSVLFLLFTKSILALLVEVPYEYVFLNKVHWGALAANILFHPIFLFFLSATVRLPGPDNTEKIVEHVQKIVSGTTELPTIVINAPRRYGTVTWALFGVIYTILFLGIFWGMSLILDTLGFSLLAIFFFILFLGLVSFLALRNRRAVDDIRLLPKREGALSAMISFLALPVLEFGSWLTRNISQVNVPLFLMDRILEAPFKLLIDVSEEWFVFVRERREEIV